ncbi:MAG: squalene synthase HpnC [Vicinamibacterales bacterium]
MSPLEEAYAGCQRLAQSHYENFPVASRLLPAHLRPHIAAIYAFARIADDFADEPGRDVEERLRLLADWRARLHSRQVLPPDNNQSPDKNQPPGKSPFPDGNSPPGFVFPALHDTIERFELPVSLFDDLLDAFTQDVTTTSYATWDEVMDYCRRSANPVGRLVLRLSGYRRDGLDQASDAVCTALQLTNFWQDLAIDWSRGRLYVPDEAWRRHGAAPETLDGHQISREWAAALQECADRTRRLFAAGRTVCDGVSGRLRYELRATWLGGVRILDRLEASGFDVYHARPRLGAGDALVIGCKTFFWS